MKATDEDVARAQAAADELLALESAVVDSSKDAKKKKKKKKPVAKPSDSGGQADRLGNEVATNEQASDDSDDDVRLMSLTSTHTSPSKLVSGGTGPRGAPRRQEAAAQLDALLSSGMGDDEGDARAYLRKAIEGRLAADAPIQRLRDALEEARVLLMHAHCGFAADSIVPQQVMNTQGPSDSELIVASLDFIENSQAAAVPMESAISRSDIAGTIPVLVSPDQSAPEVAQFTPQAVADAASGAAPAFLNSSPGGIPIADGDILVGPPTVEIGTTSQPIDCQLTDEPTVVMASGGSDPQFLLSTEIGNDNGPAIESAKKNVKSAPGLSPAESYPASRDTKPPVDTLSVENLEQRMCNIIYADTSSEGTASVTETPPKSSSKKGQTKANQPAPRRAPLSLRAMSKTKLKLLQKHLETFEQKARRPNGDYSKARALLIQDARALVQQAVAEGLLKEWTPAKSQADNSALDVGHAPVPVECVFATPAPDEAVLVLPARSPAWGAVIPIPGDTPPALGGSTDPTASEAPASAATARDVGPSRGVATASTVSAKPGDAGGLSNQAGENNCFVNVCVQALYRLVPFRKALRDGGRSLGTGSPLGKRAGTPLIDALLKVFEGLDDATKRNSDALEGAVGEIRVAESDSHPAGLAASAGAVRGALASLGSALGGRFALGEMEDAADALLVILSAIDEEIPSADAIATAGVASLTFGSSVAEYIFCPQCRRRWSAARYMQLTQSVSVYPLLAMMDEEERGLRARASDLALESARDRARDAGEQAALPPGWQCHIDASSGKPYYSFGSDAASVRWDPPPSPEQQAAADRARAAPLDPRDLPPPGPRFAALYRKAGAEQRPCYWWDASGANGEVQCSAGADQLLPVRRSLERAGACAPALSSSAFPALGAATARKPNAWAVAPPADAQAGVPPVFTLALGWPGDSAPREKIRALLSLLPCEGLDVNALFDREVRARAPLTSPCARALSLPEPERARARRVGARARGRRKRRSNGRGPPLARVPAGGDGVRRGASGAALQPDSQARRVHRVLRAALLRVLASRAAGRRGRRRCGGRPLGRVRRCFGARRGHLG